MTDDKHNTRDLVSLRWLANISAGGTPSRNKNEYWDGDIPWIGSGEVNQRKIDTPTEWITEKGVTESSTRIFPPDTVVVALAGQGKTKGTAAILKSEFAVNQSLAGIECKSEQLLPEFLLYALESAYEQLRGLAGEARDGLNLTDIKSWKIRLPPVEKQREIISWIRNIGDDILLKRNLCNRLISLLQEKKIEIVEEKIVGEDLDDERRCPEVPWFSSLPNSWQVIPLKYAVSDITVGIVRKPSQYYAEDGVPALRSKTLGKDVSIWMKLYIFLKKTMPNSLSPG